MTTDPIADLLTRIRNASRAKHSRVDLPSSKLKVELARILKEEGYLANFKVVEEQKAEEDAARVPALHAGPPQRDHGPEARFAAGFAALRGQDGHPAGGGRNGNLDRVHGPRD